jgi:hypothetical protein
MEGGTMFRFTIRELLILTVTVGLAVGWWMERRLKAEDVSDAKQLAFLSAWGPDVITFEICVRLEEKHGAKRPSWRIPK